MANLTKGHVFASGETVTATKLNDLVDSATIAFVSADDTDNSTLEASGGKLRVKDAGVTDAKLATTLDLSSKTVTLPNDSATTAVIADDAVTNAKLSLSANDGEIKKAINSDNSPPIYACRAWVNFDGTRNEANDGASTDGNNVRIRASGNVSSVTKVSTGVYTVNFTTAMPDANYSWSINGHGTILHIFMATPSASNTTSATTTALEVRVYNTSAQLVNTGSAVTVAIFR